MWGFHEWRWDRGACREFDRKFCRRHWPATSRPREMPLGESPHGRNRVANDHQISARLRVEILQDPSMRVSHEMIYTSRSPTTPSTDLLRTTRAMAGVVYLVIADGSVAGHR